MCVVRVAFRSDQISDVREELPPPRVHEPIIFPLAPYSPLHCQQKRQKGPAAHATVYLDTACGGSVILFVVVVVVATSCSSRIASGASVSAMLLVIGSTLLC